MDAFRKIQKAQCPHAYSKKRKRHVYGCECCLNTSLNTFKKESRKKAKVMFRRETDKFIQEQL